MKSEKKENMLLEKVARLSAVALIVLCGCSHNYVMILNNGTRVTASSKPKLKNGAYFYKDGSGRESSISAGRVREISPESLTKEEKQRFMAPPSK
jgi:hypothetical protein